MIAWIERMPAGMALFLLLCSGTCGAVASALLAAARLPAAGTRPGLDLLAVYAGAVLTYGLGFVTYAIALKRLPLSVAYPIMISVTMVEVFIWGALRGEPMTAGGTIGAALILAGAFLVVR